MNLCMKEEYQDINLIKLKNDVADIRKMIEDTKKMFMGGFPKPPMPPMPNVPAPMK